MYKLRKRKGEKKERGEGKEENKKKQRLHFGLVFKIATLEIDLRRKNCATQKGPFSDNVFKTPARYTSDFFRPRNTLYN